MNRSARPGMRGVTAPFSDRFRRNLLILLIVTWVIQIQPVLAGQRLDPYRLVLMVMFFPFLFGLMNGKAGRIIAPDFMILAMAGWNLLTLVLHHGGSMFALGSILALEHFGGYAAGRLLIRSSADFKRWVGYSLVALLVLSPFVVMELVTGRALAVEILGRFVAVNEKFQESRFGLSRVQAGFPHSILYGLFCSLHAASVMYIYRDRLARLVPRIVLVIFMTMASLSSAPSLSIIIQASTYIWGVITRNSWAVLMWLVLAMVVFLEVASTRGTIIILIETVTLDPSSGWWRYYIYQYGIENVMSSPIIGIGMNDWVRPYWMFASSVDNFWLLQTMRHGIPSLALLVGALAVHIWMIARRRDLSPEVAGLRNGYLIGLIGLCFSLTTVHVWDVMAVVTMFYIGAGSFFYTSHEADGAATPAPTPAGPAERRRVVYARDFKNEGGATRNSRTPK